MLQGMGSGEKMDYEYMSLMAELGEGPPPPQGTVSSWNLLLFCYDVDLTKLRCTYSPVSASRANLSPQ
jgi:hypothetical protein